MVGLLARSGSDGDEAEGAAWEFSETFSPSSSSWRFCSSALLRGFSSVSQFLQSNCSMFFPKEPSPLVSIVMLAHDKAELTFRAIISVMDQVGLVPFELVLVDDASSDVTPSLFARVINARRVRNEQPLLYAAANNQGAFNLSSPSARYLWFLNNDIELRSGRCLLSLFEILERHPSVGASGCKLIWPTEKLQEAGSMVFNHGGCYGYGRGDDPAKPEYNYVRSVDYCSGACLMVRKEVFSRLGGFDGALFPMYYEDTDLQFRIRYMEGMSVIYQPAAEVTHHEYSSSSALQAAEKMVKSERVFAERWQSWLLKYHQQAGAHNVLCGRERRPGLRVLFVDQMVAGPDFGSGFGRALEIYYAISSLGHSLTVYPLLDQRPSKGLQELTSMGVEVIHDAHVAWEPERNAADREQRLLHFLEARARTFDVVIVSRPPLFHMVHRLIRQLVPFAHVIYDAEALWYARDELRAILTKDKEELEKARSAKVIEMGLFSRCDEAWMVSEADKAKVVAGGSQARMSIVSHAVLLHPSKAPFAARKSVVFLGAFHNQVYYNGDAVLWFLREVYPLLLANSALLSMKIRVAGADPPQEVLAYHKPAGTVEVLGRVEDLDDFFAHAKVFIVPHQYGTGIQIKLLEAMSHGVPAVVMEHIAQPLRLVNVTSGVLIARNAREMASLVTELWSKSRLWSDMHTATLKFVADNYSRERLREAVSKSLGHAARTSCVPTPAAR